jgi:acyl-CoA synthetase (AMP-forming)/AMP-acid ligase II
MSAGELLVPAESPDVAVGELVSRSASRHPEKLAVKLRESGETRTFAELDARSSRLANGLLGLGLRPGERIATWMEDCLEYVEVYLAAAKAGLVVAPINARFVANEAGFLIGDSGSSALVSTPGMADQVAALGPDSTPALTIGVHGAAAEHELEPLIAGAASEAPAAPSPEDLFILGYTSGTTGKPKAAMLSHRAVVAAGRQNYVSYRISPQTVFGLTGSMSFVAVVPAHVICALGLGATLVMMGRYDVPTLIETIERERITFTYCPSPLLAEFAAAAKAAPERVRSLHSVMHSASKADPAVLKAVHAAIGDRLIEGWGMTENSGSLATATVPEDYLDADRDGTVFDTVGRAALGCSIRVTAEDGSELPHDGETIGNLAFRSPGQANGYWNRPEATAESIVDGWIFTGDLGSIDPQGFVRVTERRTDLIVSGGMNVYPSEVEQCIKQLAGVLDAGVVGVPHERWGQAVVAAVVVADDGPDEAAIVAHCRANLASYKKPNRVVFVDELPYTPTLKLSRATLRDQLAADPPEIG